MNPKTQKTLVIAGIFISLAVIIYLLKKGGAIGGNAGPVPSGGGSASGGTGTTGSGSTAGGTGPSGCTGCPSYTQITSANQVSYVNPQANRNKCGVPIQQLQSQINNLTFAANLVVDGCYGPATQAQHAATLANNNGAWPSVDSIDAYQGPSFTQPGQDAPTNPSSNWWDFFNPGSASFFDI